MQKFDFPDIDDEFVDKIQLRQYINAAIDTLSTSIAILIINKYSTDDMKTYKWFLLNITIWSYLCDMNLTIIYSPLSLFPAPSLCVLGLAHLVEDKILSQLFPFFVHIFTLGGSGSAIICAMHFRYRSTFIYKSLNIYKTKKWICAMILFHTLPAQPAFWSFVYAAYFPPGISNQAFEELHANYEFTRNITSKFSCSTLQFSRTPTFAFFITVFLIFLTYILIGLVLLIMSFYRLKNMGITPTRDFIALQKKLLFALIIQAVVPFNVLIVPYSFMLTSLMFNIKISPNLIVLLFQISSLHSCFNTLSMIISITPYREAIKKLLSFKSRNHIIDSTSI